MSEPSSPAFVVEQPQFDHPVAEAVWWACISELRALKPGNVSVFSEGHGMRVGDFTASAGCIAQILAQRELSVGERIFKSVRGTWQLVGRNTNLGIVLLAAPLTHAALNLNQTNDLRQQLRIVLRSLSVRDTRFTFDAIRLANPAGLGGSDKHDVTGEAKAPLLNVMRIAEHRDRIANQYTSDFADIFDYGLPLYCELIESGMQGDWATTGVYLGFLKQFPDTHIERKQGNAIAETVRREALNLYTQFMRADSPELVRSRLQAYDEKLKQKCINPGTSADLTVATLLTYRLIQIDDQLNISSA